MFGGHGIYLRGLFVAIAWRGRLYFKVDGTSRARYEEHGMRPYTPYPGKRLTSFYEVPEDVLASRAELRAWLDRAARAAVR